MISPAESAELMDAIRQVCPIELLRSDGSMTLAADATAAQRAAAEQAVEQFFGPAATLERAKTARCAKIDARTRELIAAGFVHGGATFSLSQAAQQNWTALAVKAGELTYPYRVSTQSDAEYALANAAALQAFLAAAFAAVESAIAGGRTIKQQVLAATTVEQVSAVPDGR